MVNQQSKNSKLIVAIVLFLVLLAAVVIGVFKFGHSSLDNEAINALQQEMKTNLGHIQILQQQYKDIHGEYWGPGLLSRNLQDKTNPMACRIENPLGFKLIDCRETWYFFRISQADTRHFIAEAVEIGPNLENRALFKKCNAPLDTWAINEKRELTTPGNALIDCLKK